MFWAVIGWIIAVVAQVMLAPIVISAVVVVGSFYALGIFLQELWLVLSVRLAGAGPSPVPPPPRGGSTGTLTKRPAEPAYLSYLAVQVWRDMWKVLRRSAVRVYRDGEKAHRLLAKAMTDEEYVAVFLFPTWIAAWIGTVALIVPIGAAAVGLAGLMAAILLAWALAWLAVVGVLGGIERTLVLLRRIVVACPHPGCHHRFGLPVYACPSETCTERHWRLVPNLHGGLRHICACGASLPTLILLGRHRLTAFCPRLDCRKPLPKRAGRVRVEHVPIVGGPDAGKSTFLALSVGALRSKVEATFEDARDERAITDALGLLRRGERLSATTVELPRALMLDVRPPGGDGRILYFFDPAGEYYTSGEKADSQRYLDHAEIVLIVVDPLALDGVQHSLTDADRRIIGQAAPPNQSAGTARESPGAVTDRLLRYLQTRGDKGWLRRVLVVVSKTDVMRRTTVGATLGGPAPDVRAWLGTVGWGNWTRSLDTAASDVRYLASGLDLTEAAFADAVTWLTGLPLADGPPPAQGKPTRQPWVSPSRPGTIPRGYAAGRMTLLVLVGVASVAATLYGVWMVIGSMFGLY